MISFIYIYILTYLLLKHPLKGRIKYLKFWVSDWKMVIIAEGVSYTTLNIGFLTNLKNLVYVFAIFHPTLMSIEALSLY